MPTVTLRPNADQYIAPNASVITQPTAWQATSDGNDGSYVHCIHGANFVVKMATTTIPAGAVISQLQLQGRIRWSGVPQAPATIRVDAQFETAGGPDLFAAEAVISPPDVAFWYNTIGPVMGVTFSQAWLDQIVMVVSPRTGADQAYDTAELFMYVTYATQPTVAVVAPTGTITDSTAPSVVWSYAAGTDGGAQTQYQVRVFTAAQYGAGGFDPGTSTATYDTGIQTGSAASATVGPLANGTYRAYVRAAQTINGAAHWSAYAFTPFVLNAVTSDITSVVAAADSVNGRNTMVVTRNGATPAWTSVEVQATYDGGATWVYVRGYTRKAVVAGDSPLTVSDYEASNGVAAQYRARATYQLTGRDVTGAWVLSASVTWADTSPCSVWLKDPAHPSRNMHLDAQMPDIVQDRVQGVFRPIGATYPVVISDVLQAGTATITIVTRTDADAVRLRTVAAGGVLLLQTPAGAGWQYGSRYVAPGALTESHTTPGRLSTIRVWSLGLVEVARPPDDGVS